MKFVVYIVWRVEEGERFENRTETVGFMVSGESLGHVATWVVKEFN